MKLLGLLLFLLLSLVQYPLWIGPGSWFRVWELDSLLSDQQARNAGLRLRNEGLEAELEDLRHGKLAIEERARYSLGMIRDDEIFVQLSPSAASPPPPITPDPRRTPGLRKPASQGEPARPGAGRDRGHGAKGTAQAVPPKREAASQTRMLTVGAPQD